MTYKLVLEVPLAPTDSNKILGVNKFVKHQIFKKIKNQIRVLSHQKQPAKPLENFQISVTRYGARYLDWDNFVASLKPFIDALTLAKIIKDDSYEFIKSINTHQVKSREKKLVITVIGELDEAKNRGTSTVNE